MKCEDFKNMIISSENNEDELSDHLDTCISCKEWLDAELSQAPKGLTPAQWQAATARCFPAIDDVIKEDPAKTESFWSFFGQGLKYGMVFGLSIVTGFAILSLKIDNPPRFNLEAKHEISFLTQETKELPGFLEIQNFDVTFLSYNDSELMSFVENIEMPNFLELTQEEEL